MEKLRFLTEEQVRELAGLHGTPLFVYSVAAIRKQLDELTSSDSRELNVRYAMKANSHPQILKFLRTEGVQIDASSSYEAAVALKAGFTGNKILLNGQQPPHNMKELLRAGVELCATSLRQLELFGQASPGNITVRINPGTGSGAHRHLTTAGPNASFGIWHEYIPQVHAIAKRRKLKITRLHTHIGSGSDPRVWQKVVRSNIGLLDHFPDVVTLNVGGGFKVARMKNEPETDTPAIVRLALDSLETFHRRTGRRVRLEVEPGTYLVANAGSLISRVVDITDTGKNGYRFVRLDTGMNDILRPALYGAQHPIVVVASSAKHKGSKPSDFIVVGHNCESGDTLTLEPGNPDVLLPRRLNSPAIDDFVVIEGAGAYCASMRAIGYNGYPPAKEIIID